MQNAQTKATAKYQKRVGLISKTYKLKQEVVDAFAAACEEAGTSQAAQLTKMMRGFIEESGGLEGGKNEILRSSDDVHEQRRREMMVF